MDKEKVDSERDSRATNSRSSEPKEIPQRSVESGNRDQLNLGASGMFPSVPASPPSFVSLEQILKAAEDVTQSEFNMALAHEIAVNKDFKLKEKSSKSSFEERVSEICHKVFWDLLADDLSSTPPKYDQAMVLIKEIKEILLWLLLPHNSRLKNEINNVLDLDLIEQQARKSCIDVLSYGSFVISTMARMCAPARDEKVQSLRLITEVVPLYKGILETLDLLKLDMVNFTISHIRPHLQRHSIEYEKKKFQEIIHSLESLTPPVDGLKFTRLWLQNVVSELANANDGVHPNNITVLRKAYLKILQWKETESFPETLHLDHERFITLRDNLTVMALTASVILVTYSTVGPSIQGISEFKDQLKSHIQIVLADAPHCSSHDLEAKMQAVGLQVEKEVNECLQSHGYSTLSEENGRIMLASIKKIADENHNVRQLIIKRVIEFLDHALCTSSAVKIPPGLSSLQHELSSLTGQFLSLVNHNQSVFGDYYNEMIDRCRPI